MARRLDYWAKADTFAWLDQREDEIWDRYVELGSVDDLITELAAQCNGLAPKTFYAWLRNSDQREEQWDELKNLRGYISADKGLKVALQATQQNANAARLKYEAHMRAAEWQNRAVFGKRPDVAIAVGVGGEWQSALAAVLEPDNSRLLSSRASESSCSAPPTGKALTRALPEKTDAE